MNLKILNSFHLKIIALVTMVIDHLGSVFFDDIIILRIIGRVAFILYAFMLVNGVDYTSDISKYLKKLFIWAILSEIPHDLIFYDCFFSFERQNIFFTLFLGALGLHLYKKYQNILIKVLVYISGILLAYVLKVDYSWYGVSLIYGMYLVRNFELLKLGLILILSLFYAVIVPDSLGQFFAFIGVLPIYLYNGKQGKKTGNIYYSYYSIHLLIFYIINTF